MSAVSFTCPVCGARSFHPKDIEHGYCGRCHAFTRELGCEYATRDMGGDWFACVVPLTYSRARLTVTDGAIVIDGW